MGCCEALLVSLLQVHTLVDEELDHLVATRFDGVEYGSLAIVVDDVERSLVVNEELRGGNVTFSDAVENRCLAVFIYMVGIGALLEKKINNFVFAISDRVKQGDLVEHVGSGGLATHLNEHVDQAQGILVAGGHTSAEQGRLLEAGFVTENVGYINADIADHLQHLVNFSLFQLVEELSVKRQSCLRGLLNSGRSLLRWLLFLQSVRQHGGGTYCLFRWGLRLHKVLGDGFGGSHRCSMFLRGSICGLRIFVVHLYILKSSFSLFGGCHLRVDWSALLQLGVPSGHLLVYLFGDRRLILHRQSLSSHICSVGNLL